MDSQLQPVQTEVAVPAAPTAVPPSEQFVNAGLLTWLERRRQWTTKTVQQQHQRQTPRKRTYSPAVTPQQVLSFSPFPKPVPLQEVIEALAEVWDQEEFYS